MFLIFDIPSSLVFWRNKYPLDRTPRGAVENLSVTNAATRRQDVEGLLSQISFCDELTVEGEWHFLVLSERSRRKTTDYTCRTWTGELPYGSLYQLKKGIYVESPELMFVRAASFLPIEQLIAFGDELCGLYSFSPEEERGFRVRSTPLVNKAQLKRFLASLGKHWGGGKASQALPFIVENSASPMETFDEMTMCLPLRFGGYGIRQPIMNREIGLDPKAKRIAQRATCRLDMSWDGIMLDVEHHGKLDHFSEEDMARDRRRVNALKEMEYEVIELTNEQVNDLFAYEYIIEYIAKTLGKRLRKDGKGALPERIQLRESVRAWNASSGFVSVT